MRARLRWATIRGTLFFFRIRLVIPDDLIGAALVLLKVDHLDRQSVGITFPEVRCLRDIKNTWAIFDSLPSIS